MCLGRVLISVLTAKADFGSSLRQVSPKNPHRRPSYASGFWAKPSSIGHQTPLFRFKTEMRTHPKKLFLKMDALLSFHGCVLGYFWNAVVSAFVHDSDDDHFRDGDWVLCAGKIGSYAGESSAKTTSGLIHFEKSFQADD